jgi:hypothetical protein
VIFAFGLERNVLLTNHFRAIPRRSRMSWIFETYPSFSFVFLRLGLAVAFFAHSTQQIFGWYGGRGLKGMLANWKEKYAIPTPSAWSGC